MRRAGVTLRHATGELSLERCLVMGIVNRTPDSFYDGGRMTLDETLAHAQLLVEQGADILDLGAVKAGPGPEVSEQEEIDRLLPAVEALRLRISVPISIETSRASVAKLAFASGASMLNDVTALTEDDLARVCAEAGGALVLMHHGGQLRGRPRNPRYTDIVAAVTDEWERLVERAQAAGIGPDAILVDPGLDFGKNTFHSLELLDRLPELVAAGWPLLLAASRKDVVGETLGVGPQDRLEGSLAIAALAARARVAVLRVHDVEATVRVVHMVEAVDRRRRPQAPVRGLWD